MLQIFQRFPKIFKASVCSFSVNEYVLPVAVVGSTFVKSASLGTTNLLTLLGYVNDGDGPARWRNEISTLSVSSLLFKM